MITLRPKETDHITQMITQFVDILGQKKVFLVFANQINLVRLTVIILSGFVKLYLKNFIHLLIRDLSKVGNVIFMVVL